MGNRNILANPRIDNIKERLNKKIKFREEFHPFAPAILKRKFNYEYKDKADFSNMTITAKVNNTDAKNFLGAVYEDLTSRIQLVDSSNNIFDRLLCEIGRTSGHDSLINTSFNLKGEPIVDSPADALRTFFSSGLDVLYLGDAKIVKS